jgi:uncharacterized membrane-anchored protein YhcB (DUF1043 family)
MASQENIQTTKESESPSTTKQVLDILKHPLILLVIGATITSLLVPYLNAKVNRNEILQAARLKKAIEIGEHNTEFNSKFNTLKTMLESFHKRSVSLQLKPAEFKVAQSKFLDEFSRRYLDLDEKAWWWYPALEREASILGLTSRSELQTLDTELQEYGDNLNKSFNILRPLWRKLTSYDYNPNDKEYANEVDQIILNVNDPKNGLPPLFQARNILIERIAGHFTSP